MKDGRSVLKHLLLHRRCPPQFIAEVFDASPSVTWSIRGNNGGTTDASGLYTAPLQQGQYHVIAQTSSGNLTTVPVMVGPPDGVTVTPEISILSTALSDQQTGEMGKRWNLEGQKVSSYLKDNNGRTHFTSTAGDADANNDYSVDPSEVSGVIPALIELMLGRPGYCMYQLLGNCISVKTTQIITKFPLLALFYVEPINLPSGIFIPNDIVVAVTSAIGPGATHRQLPPFATAKPPFQSIFIAKNHSVMKNVNTARTLWEDILYDYPDFIYVYPK